jgi:hypothetical protein
MRRAIGRVLLVLTTAVFLDTAPRSYAAVQGRIASVSILLEENAVREVLQECFPGAIILPALYVHGFVIFTP